MTSPAHEILHRVFGYPEFRGHQAEVVEHVSNGGDALVLMPTGGGKSLCFQIPALLRPGVGVEMTREAVGVVGDGDWLGVSWTVGSLSSPPQPVRARARTRATPPSAEWCFLMRFLLLWWAGP